MAKYTGPRLSQSESSQKDEIKEKRGGAMRRKKKTSGHPEPIP